MANHNSDPVGETRSKSTSEVVRSYLRYNHVILGSMIKCTFVIRNEIWSRDTWKSDNVWCMVHPTGCKVFFPSKNFLVLQIYFFQILYPNGLLIGNKLVNDNNRHYTVASVGDYLFAFKNEPWSNC